jgi:hypothetical protein
MLAVSSRCAPGYYTKNNTMPYLQASSCRRADTNPSLNGSMVKIASECSGQELLHTKVAPF